MSATIYWSGAWKRARDERARAGKAPRLSIRRAIVLQQTPDGSWIAGIHTLRFGRWGKATWLCSRAALPEARRAALTAWERDRLPLLWAYAGEAHVHPFYRGINEPQGARA